MRDYEIFMADGSTIAVARAPMELLHSMLSNGFDIMPGAVLTQEAGRERMQLELEIRALGLGEV